MLRLYIVLFFLTSVHCLLFAQEQEIDSLLALLEKRESLEEKADVLNQLSFSIYHSDLKRGLDYANQALAFSRQANYGGGTRRALSLVGYYYHETGEFREAMSYYRESLNFPGEPDIQTGHNYVMLGNVYRSLASYDSANVFYSKGISLLRTINEDKELAYALRNAGRSYLKEWKNEEAEKAFNEAFSIYEQLGNDYGKADVYFAMAELSVNKGNYILAQEQINTACALADRMEDDYMKLMCLIFNGEIQFRLGEFLQSLETLLKALELLKKWENPQILARVYGDVGDVYETLSQNDVAMRYFLEATKIAERLGLKYELAKYQSNIAWIHKNQRNYESAFDFIERSYKLRTEIGDVAGISNCFNVKSIIYFQQKNYPEAIHWLEKALKLRESINHREGVAACLYNLGLVYEEQKLYKKSLSYQFRALALEKQIGNRFNIGIAYNSVGSVYTYLKQYDSASHFLTMAQEIGEKTGSLELQMENCYYWSEYHELMGNDKDALKWHKRYATLNDSVYYENSATKLAEMQALYQTDQKDKEIHILNQEKLLQSNQIQLQDARINLQSFVIVFVIVAFLLVSLLAYKSYQYNKEIKTAHTEIVKQKEEIQLQADELQKAYNLIANSHKELEVKVEERTSELRKAYQELDTFFYRASHDFRRPLTTFLGLVEVANITVKDSAAMELFHKVEETAIYLDKMLFKLQSISDLGSQQLDYGEVCVPTIFKEVLKSFEHLLEEKSIRTEVSWHIPEKFCSYPALIHTIVENLIENSIAFCRYEDAFIKLRASQCHEFVLIEVEDNGDGIDQKYQDRMFEMYFRANERSKGNGLGLYIVKKAMERISGTLEFTTARDKGTIFRLKFPLKTESLQLSV